ncbi:MAG: restriction endonuclease subunit S [Leptolyngbyaceae cyanobacterium]
MNSLWRTAPLQEVVEEDSPITYGVVKPGKEGDVLFVRGGDVSNGRILHNQLRTISQEVSAQYQRTLLRGGELVVSLVGQPGQVAVVPSFLAGANIARQVGMVRLQSILNANFVSYFLQSPDGRKSLGTYTGGSVQQVINLRDLRTVNVPIPPIAEQKQIVAILDEAFEGIDSAISNTEKNLANARELFESYLNAIFTRKGDDWEDKKIKDVAEKVEYGTSAKSSPDGEVPVLRMGNIQNGVLDWNDLVYTDNQEDIDKYLLKYNDVLFNRTNSAEHVGKTAIYKGDMPAIFAGYLIRIHRKEDLIDADFLNFYLNSYRAREYGKSVMSQSVNQANINGTKLKDYPIPVPPLTEQTQIVKKLSCLLTETQRLEAIYQQKLAALNELKQSTLQRAFSGELTVEVGDAAVAGVIVAA